MYGSGSISRSQVEEVLRNHGGQFQAFARNLARNGWSG
jgi:hypothetical protein